jgi:hypothetical protein
LQNKDDARDQEQVDGEERKRKNAAATPSAWRTDWKTAAERTDNVPVR